MPETFSRESKYGLTVMTTTDEGLLRYMHNVQKQVTEWLLAGLIQRLVVVVQGADTLETLERWQFNITIDDDENAGGSENQTPNHSPSNNGAGKSIKEIHNEIQAIIRQITASVTFLPLLQEPCTFDLLVYTDKEVKAPEKWADSDPCYIMNSAEVKLRSFTTSVHKVDSMVAYKEVDEWDL
jgi:mitotic spindle assembly checkpoint protein MAD2